jgi:biopolymer transport protein ExbB
MLNLARLRSLTVTALTSEVEDENTGSPNNTEGRPLLATIPSLFTSLLAQTTSPVETMSVEVTSVWDFIVKGGPMMFPILLCSLIALTVVVERVVSLRPSRVNPPEFLPGLRTALSDKNGDRRAALAWCDKDGSPLAAVLAAGIRNLGQPVERIEKQVREAGEREIIKLRKYLRVLAVIAAVAPLMGLLGTIFGMIDAFQTVASSGEALGKTELLARGIYEAMITTAAGLLLAIPVLVAYHWMNSKIEQLVLEMDRISVEFVEHVALPPDGRADGRWSVNATSPTNGSAVADSSPADADAEAAGAAPATAG